MTSFAQAILIPGQQWTTIVTIEGLGEYAGLWKLCSRVPTYAASDPLYKPWLTDYPDILSERVEPLGGLPQSGELSISVLDVGRAMTSALRYLSGATDYWASDLTAAATTGTLGSGANHAAGTLLFSGNECIRIVSKSSTTAISAMDRGFLDTDPWQHRARDNTFASNHYLNGRRMRLYIAPADGNSATDEREIGQYVIDSLEYDDTLNALVLRGTTQMQYLARTLPRQPVNFVVHQYIQNPEALDLGSPTYDSMSPWLSYAAARIGDETLKLSVATRPHYIDAHSVLGTAAFDPTNTNPYPPGTVGTWLLSADPDVGASFRRSDGSPPSTSPFSGSWTICTHPIDILLCLILSSYHADDGLYFTNYSGGSNWSCLPVGWGLGIPVTKVDVQSFLDIKVRFPDLDYRDFVIGDQTQSFADMVTETFLRPLGAYFSTDNGQLRMIVPRLPAEADTSVAIGTGDLLTDALSDVGGSVLPGVKVSLNTQLLISSVSYVIKDANGQERTFRVDNSDFAETFGQRGYYGTEAGTVKINLHSYRAPRVGVPAAIRELAYKRLFRFHRPLMEIKFRTPLRFLFLLLPGYVCGITMPELPDPSAGVRGWTSVRAEIIERRAVINADGTFIEWTAISYGPSAKVDWIAPAAYVTAVAGAGPYVCTVSANRYTQADAPSWLPNTDAGAFTVGDRVALRALDGLDLDTGVYYTVTSIGINSITIDGNFGGALAAGTILCYTDVTQAVSQQTTRFAFQADRATLTPGASGAPYVYGES